MLGRGQVSISKVTNSKLNICVDSFLLIKSLFDMVNHVGDEQ